MAYALEEAINSINIAEMFDNDYLFSIGNNLGELVDSDDDSRQEWLEDQDDWLKLAAQVRETKSFPWHRASNVKFPLMTVACLQFHARALPGLINSSNPVRARVIGRDPGGEKLARADRVGQYMSYQILEEMEEWMDDMDRMLMVLPIIGMCFKKTYYSENLGRLKSCLIMPRDLILNYHATDYVRARMSHVIMMDQNELKECQRQGIFLDIDLPDEHKAVQGARDETIGLTQDQGNPDDPYEIVESHCWLDLDEDGYKEPYIVTYHRDSRQILRIVARWDEDGIQYGTSGKVSKIVPTEYFTPFVFLPDPNSSVYGLGFGRLLGPTNEAVNTIINQLMDAGTLSNLQSGFIGRGIKLNNGMIRFGPGEWKQVNTTGDDLRKGIFPMPVREPSQVLFNLLGMLIDSGQQISAVSDMMVGENPGQNQPATTTMAVLEQGLKVFTGIFKRIHRSLGKEYKKIYELDGKYLDEEMYNDVLDEAAIDYSKLPPETTPEEIEAMKQQAQGGYYTIEDFEEEKFDIRPTSDPTMVSNAQRAVKAESLLNKAMSGVPINMEVATRRVLEAEGHEDIKEIMAMPPQPPSLDQLNYDLDVEKVKIDALDVYNKGIKLVAEAEALEKGQQLDEYRAIVDDNLKIVDRQQGQQNNANGPTSV